MEYRPAAAAELPSETDTSYDDSVVFEYSIRVAIRAEPLQLEYHFSELLEKRLPKTLCTDELDFRTSFLYAETFGIPAILTKLEGLPMHIDLHTLRTTALRAAQLEAHATPILIKLRRVLIDHGTYLRLGIRDRAELIAAQPPRRISRNVDPPARVVTPRSRGGDRKTLHILRAAVKMLAANRRLVNSVLRQRAAEARRAHAALLAEKAARRLEAPKQRRRLNLERILRRRAEAFARVKRERSVGRQYSMCLILAQREKAKALRCFDRILYERLLAHAEVLRPRVRGAREGWATLPAEYAAAPDLVDVAAAA